VFVEEVIGPTLVVFSASPSMPFLPPTQHATQAATNPAVQLAEYRATTMPFSSSHSLFECCQHAICPYARVRPVAHRRRLSGGGSRERHCHRFVISLSWFGPHASIFLHPFAPPALLGFVATMGALTPGRSALRILIRDNELRPCIRPGLSPYDV